MRHRPAEMVAANYERIARSSMPYHDDTIGSYGTESHVLRTKINWGLT